MTLQGKTRIAFLVFFASHIPITLLIDGQAFFNRSFYPETLQNVVDWYAYTFKVREITIGSVESVLHWYYEFSIQISHLFLDDLIHYDIFVGLIDATSRRAVVLFFGFN